MPGSQISKRLAIFGVGFVGLLLLIAVLGPRIGWHHKSAPVIETKQLSNPIEQPAVKPQLYQKPTLKTVIATKTETKKAVCQPCIQAAQEVLTRYLNAIRTGAGTQEEQEASNVLETDRVYPADRTDYAAPVLGADDLHAKYQRQFDTRGALPSPFNTAR